jgi:hypothetical protein
MASSAISHRSGGSYLEGEAAGRPRICDPCYLRMLLEDGHGNYKSVEESLVQYNSGWLEYLSSIQRVRVPILTGRSR